LLQPVCEYTKQATDEIVVSLEQIKKVEEWIMLVCNRVDEARRSQLRDIIISFQDVTTKARDIGCTLCAFGKSLRNKNHERLMKFTTTLEDIMLQLDDLQKQFKVLFNDMNQTRKDIDDDLFKAKLIMGFAIATAIIGMGILITIATFGIGGLVGCPIFCCVLTSMGLTEAGALLGVGIGAGVAGAGIFCFGAARAHSAMMTKKDLATMQDILQHLAKETNKVRKMVNDCQKDLVQAKKYEGFNELDLNSCADTFERAGQILVEGAQDATNKLYDIETYLVSTTSTSSCVLI